MINYTKKTRFGGDLNIYSKYDPEEIRKMIDNYLAAAYALKQSAEELNEAVKIKYDTKDDESTASMDKKNSEMFLKATRDLNNLIGSLKRNIK